MNKNLKKIMLTTMFSVASISAIGLGQQTKMMAQNENHLHKNIAAKTISNDTQNSTSLGKIISASAYNDRQYISPKIQTNSIEENITNQTTSESGLKLFILTNIPFANITTDENNSTQNNQTTTNYNDELNLKRSIFAMIKKCTKYIPNVILLKNGIILHKKQHYIYLQNFPLPDCRHLLSFRRRKQLEF